MNLNERILEFGRRAHVAARLLRVCTTEQKDAGIRAMADELVAAKETILAANAEDVARAKTAGISAAMIERLTLNPKRIAEMADGVRQIADLPDPAGQTVREWTRPNGFHPAPLGMMRRQARPTPTRSSRNAQKSQR